MEDKLQFYFKKTTDLDIEEKNQINNLYNDTFINFIDRKRTIDDFLFKYKKNYLGFSFHGIIKSKDKIIGSYNVIPGEFLYFKEKKYFGQSVDTAIDKNFKGNIYNLRKLAHGVYQMLLKHDISFVYGLPNKSFYKVKKKVLNWNDIGNLNFYIHPIDLKKILGKFKLFNSIILNLLKIFYMLKYKKEEKYNSNIKKKTDSNFIDMRFDSTYLVYKNTNYNLIYKTIIKKDYSQSKFVYIIDVLPFSINNLEDSVKKISEIEKNIDLIIYPDIGKFKIKNMIKVPDFIFKNKPVVSGKILDEKIISKSIFNKHNWQINLSNFDIK